MGTLGTVRTLTIKALKGAIKTADEKLVFDADKISVPKDEKKESLIQTLVDRFLAAGVEDVRKYAKAVDPQEANVPPAVQAAVVPQTQVQRAAREVLILEGMWCCVCVWFAFGGFVGDGTETPLSGCLSLPCSS